MLAPPKLQPGDAVSVVAPSGPFDRPAFEKGIDVLRGFGLHPLFDERLFARQRYLAGPDSQRLELLEAAIADPGTKAIWCARGGYGATRLLSALKLRALLERPKLFVGFSDATVLHAAWNARGLRTLHAPVLTQLGSQPAEVLERLRALLFSAEPPTPLLANPVSTFSPGRARGLLLGGNLSILSRLIGTPHLPSLAGAVLFFEDVGERPYRLDRLWTHLTLAGAFEGLRGIGVGELTGCEEKDADYRALDVVGDLVPPAPPAGCRRLPRRPRRGQPTAAARSRGRARRRPGNPDVPRGRRRVTAPAEPKLRALLEEAVREGVATAISAAVLFRGEWLHLSASGVVLGQPALPSTWFDLASLTKPLATGLCALRLAHLGKIDLEAPVARYLPRFAREGKSTIELLDLLDHTSGLPTWRPYFRAVAEDPVGAALFGDTPAKSAFERGRELVAAAVDAEGPSTPRRVATAYSDVGFLALGRVLAEISGEALDTLWRREILDRLAIADCSFFDLARRPAAGGLGLAPTGSTRPREPAPGQEEALAGLPLRPVGLRPGEVDDDNAFACGGVAGHAGLFGTVGGVAELAQAFLAETEGAGKLANAELANRFATPRPGSTRALAWDRPSAENSSLGSRLGRGPRGAVGHLGFTGCSVWIDLDARLVIALCSNRTLTGRSNQAIRAFRPRFHDSVAALLGL